MELHIQNAEPAVSASIRESILQSLHRMAQPLCTIRGILELTSTEVLTAEEKTVWLQKAVEEITQANSRFDQLRQIVEQQIPISSGERLWHG